MKWPSVFINVFIVLTFWTDSVTGLDNKHCVCVCVCTSMCVCVLCKWESTGERKMEEKKLKMKEEKTNSKTIDIKIASVNTSYTVFT